MRRETDVVHKRSASQTTDPFPLPVGPEPSDPNSSAINQERSSALRAITKSAFNLLGVSLPHIARIDCFDPVREFILHGAGKMENFIRWGIGNALDEPRIGPVDHFLAVWSDDNGVWGHCQLYGALLHPIRLSSTDVGERFSFSYLVDPLREGNPGERRHVRFQPLKLQRFAAAEPRPGPPVWTSITSRFRAPLAASRSRMAGAQVGKIVEEVLLPYAGQRLTRDTLRKLADRIAEYVASLSGGK